jgi:tripartite-type tricarboxylate transporter receptor subunit TctC
MEKNLRRQFSKRLIASGTVIALGERSLVMTSGNALAQSAQHHNWPGKAIKIVVPYPPGGPLDQIARALAERMRESLGQAVVVENRAGAGGNIGADYVAKAQADGHTLVIGAVATHAINPFLYARMPYDANRDFAPIGMIAMVPNVLVMTAEVAQRLGISKLSDLVAYGKRYPGKLNYASGGNGSAGHLAAELFKSAAGFSMVHIPYAGAAPAQLGLLAGQTDLMFDNLASAAGQIQAGRLKAFAVTSAQRSSQSPELPTVAEHGFPGFDISTWFGLMAPAGTPDQVVKILHRAMTQALESKELKERLSRMKADSPLMTPDTFKQFILQEQRKYEALVKASGASVD